MSYITNRPFDELEVGSTASLSRTLTDDDIKLFAFVSGDVNPAHVDPEFAKNDLFHKVIAHGMWGGSLISTVLGTKLPGPGTIYLNQSLKFLRPIALGDKITVEVTVTRKYKNKPILELQCQCKNQLGKEVIVGKAKVLAPTEKIKRKRIELPHVFLSEQIPHVVHSKK